MLAQSILQLIYHQIQKHRIADLQVSRRVFASAYFLYKRFLEDPFYLLGRKQPELFAGGHILDIGANIGYTAALFSKLLSPGYRVYAFEPDLANYELLKKYVSRKNLDEKIIHLQTAVGDQNNVLQLWHNPYHHGDHRILTQDYAHLVLPKGSISSVPVLTIDDFAKGERIDQAISFIKIDVQGYELPVCRGMLRSLAANPQAHIALEYDVECIRALGYSPDELLLLFRELDYRRYLIDKNGNLTDVSDCMQYPPKGSYFNLLMSKNRLA